MSNDVSQAANLAEAKRLFFSGFGNHPRATEVAGRFEALRDEPTFLRHLSSLAAFKQGLDPIPNRSSHEVFLRASGHEFAANDVLPRGSFLRNLFIKRPTWESYLGLHGVIAARLMTKPGPLSDRRIEALYATLDRLIRGGADWTEVRRVPAITRRDYQGIGKVTVPTLTHASSSLISILQAVPAAGYSSTDFRLFCTTHYAALRFVVAAITWGCGRTKAAVDDHFQAAEAYLKLFEVDPLDLPPLVREGLSGYQQK